MGDEEEVEEVMVAGVVEGLGLAEWEEEEAVEEEEAALGWEGLAAAAAAAAAADAATEPIVGVEPKGPR